MGHRPDFTMTIWSGQLAMCDVCSGVIGNDEERLRTFVGTTAQSDVCMDCARLIKRLTRAERRPATDGPLSVPADAPSEAVTA